MEVMKLHVDADKMVKDGRPVLVLLHGFTQNGKSWATVRNDLRRIGPTVAVDLIGHGESPKPEDPRHYTLDACIEQVEQALSRLKIDRAWWLGYSMGGRVALNMATKKPERVQGLLLLSTTPGISGPDVRRQRKEADLALAERLLGWDMEDFVDYWLSLPLFESLKRLPTKNFVALRHQRLKNSPVGLSNSLKGMGTGAMLPLWPYLQDISVPALVMAGELDEKFMDIARGMAQALPEGNLSILPDVGHAAHLEKPQQFIRSVIGFFQRLE